MLAGAKSAVSKHGLIMGLQFSPYSISQSSRLYTEALPCRAALYEALLV